MNTPYQFHFGDNPAARAVIEDGLKAFNTEVIGQHLYSNHSAYRNLELYARDERGEVVGGLFGNDGMGWMYVDYLWLHPDHRGSGLGRRLMALVDDEARRRGCVGVFLYTYSFQAPGFYQRCGFELMGELEDCPPGHRRLYLKKRLPPL